MAGLIGSSDERDPKTEIGPPLARAPEGRVLSRRVSGLDWGPAGVVRDEFLALWQRYFGRNYQAFDHAGCRFVLVDAQGFQVTQSVSTIGMRLSPVPRSTPHCEPSNI